MTMKKKQVSLPDKPSALIRLALRDLEKAEKSKRYRIDMGYFHAPNGKCRVCLAGAVLAFSVKVDRDFNSMNVGKLPENNKMMALDAARRGCMDEMFEHLSLERPESVPPFARMPAYSNGRRAFKSGLKSIVALLAKAGA